MTDFEELKQAVIEICHERDACRKGYRELLDCENTPQLVECFCRYWGDIMGNRFNEKAIAFMEKYYQPNRELWRRCGLAYQEGNSHGYVWLMDKEDVICEGTARVYVVGKCKVELRDLATAVMDDCTESEVTLKGNSKCTCKCDAVVKAYDNAHPNMMAGRCYCDGSGVQVDAGGSADIYGKMWGQIIATGYARVYSANKFRVKIFSNAEWIQTDNIKA